MPNDKLDEAMQNAEQVRYDNGVPAADDPSGYLISTMANPEVAQEKPDEGFNRLNTLQALNETKKKGFIDNIHKRNLAEIIFDPTLDQEKLEEVNSKLETTIIIKQFS